MEERTRFHAMEGGKTAAPAEKEEGTAAPPEGRRGVVDRTTLANSLANFLAAPFGQFWLFAGGWVGWRGGRRGEGTGAGGVRGDCRRGFTREPESTNLHILTVQAFKKTPPKIHEKRRKNEHFGGRGKKAKLRAVRRGRTWGRGQSWGFRGEGGPEFGPISMFGPMLECGPDIKTLILAKLARLGFG